MNSVKFKLNGRLEIYYGDDIYRSSIHDISEDYIAINVPIKDGMYVTPNVDDKLEVLYYEDQCAYKFETSVITRRMENNIPQILLALPQDVNRIQRRQYVRVAVINYLRYVKIERDTSIAAAEDKLNQNQSKKALLLDLSGGGFKMKVYEPLNIGDKILTYIECEDIKVRVTGQVLRIEKDDDGRLNCGFGFTDMDFKLRENIIKIIFTIMRKQRRTL
jgi:c-di-GMP-binding flagellar brake protein YcgR